MMYPVIGAYRLGDKVRIEVDGVLREGEIICIGLNGYVVAADACVFVVNDPQIKWCLRTSGEDEPTEEIKCGDIVRVKVNTPKDVWRGAGSKAICTRYKFLPFEVTGIEEDGIETMAYATSFDGFIYIRIPTRYLEPYYSAEHVRRMEKDLQREKEQHLREHSDKDKPHDNTITIPVKADFGEDVGFALLNKAFELQKNYTELECEIKRLYELVNDAMNGLHPLRLAFDNSFLGSIANMIYSDFRPLTEEEKAQFLIDIKNMANNLKKQSE